MGMNVRGRGRVVRAVLFDLDGTLLDTLGDLADAINWALRELGLPERSEDEVRRFVGDGVAKLVQRALPDGSEGAFEACMAGFKARYAAHMNDRTRPYPGIIGLLDALGARGIACAVVSNKFDGAVGPLCERFFGGRIGLALGEREGMPRKPAPDGCHWLMDALGVSADEVVYVGDSDTDVETAHNAGLRCVGVSWGFRDRDNLTEAGADAVVDDVDGLLSAILN